MVSSLRSLSLRCLIAGLMCSALPAAADDVDGVVRLGSQQDVGVVRISDQSRNETTVRGQSPAPAVDEFTLVNCIEGADCTNGACGACGSNGQCGNGCPGGAGCRCGNGSSYVYGDAVYGDGYAVYSCPEGKCGPMGDWFNSQAFSYRSRNMQQSAILGMWWHDECQAKHAWLRGKFGYFVPTGCCGKGCPPIGHYSMVYPVDPNYFDNRDGQVYAAPGYGGPVSVPLAPVVNHTYNYGWGVPSSRLTPVLHPAQPAAAAFMPSPVPSAPVAQ